MSALTAVDATLVRRVASSNSTGRHLPGFFLKLPTDLWLEVTFAPGHVLSVRPVTGCCRVTHGYYIADKTNGGYDSDPSAEWEFELMGPAAATVEGDWLCTKCKELVVWDWSPLARTISQTLPNSLSEALEAWLTLTTDPLRACLRATELTTYFENLLHEYALTSFQATGDWLGAVPMATVDEMSAPKTLLHP